MDWDGFDGLVRAHFEPLQYAAFFGALVLLGAIEGFLPLARAGADRPRRWPANAGLTALNILVLGAMPVSVVAVADQAMARGWGLLNQSFVPPLAALALGFAARSLIAYGIHVAMHKVPLLWRVHRVHHSDTHMDVSTTVRFHPLEFVVSTPILLALAVALGIPPLALMLYEVFDAAMAVFTHANARLPEPFDRALRLILATPAMHRVHHSADQRETDSNYGATFSWWDRLFGTYRMRPPGELAAMNLGLAEWRGRRATALAWLLAMPFVAPAAIASRHDPPEPAAESADGKSRP
jgi:sterol desaturase/sphingolipid hydroxylase (fatty acid hydroxylase superfamily)